MAAQVTVRKFDNTEDAVWDNLVKQTPDAGDFLRSTCLWNLTDTLNPSATLVRLVVEDEKAGGPVAGWALMIRRRLGVRYNTQFPYYYNGPFVAAPYDRDPGQGARRIRYTHLLARAVLEEVDVIDAECPPGFEDVRGMLYAGFRVEQRSCHVWRAGEVPILKRFNRTKRNEARRAMRTHTFGWEEMSPEGLAAFRRLHDAGLAKFSWNPPEKWREALDRQTALGKESGMCRLFGARDESGTCRALVSVLFNPLRQTAYLWRVGFDSDQTGLIAAMYAEAAEAVRQEKGMDWEINFGGSPRFSLSLFKDYLGAEAVFHAALLYQRPGWPWMLWNGVFGLKELRFAVRRKYHSLRKRA